MIKKYAKRGSSIFKFNYATKPFQYDKVLYLIEETEKNSHLVNEVVKILDYPDGQIAVQYGEKKLSFRTFDKLAKVEQTQVVDNKRLGKVLQFAQEKQEEFDKAQLRERSRNAPKRTTQKRAIAQIRSLNPVLAVPDDLVEKLDHT